MARQLENRFPARAVPLNEIGLRSGMAGFVWWERRWIHRDREPLAYWVLVIINFAVFIYFVINGRHMRLR